ncbi:hypothetical protein MMC28_007391 [Mycoblastus sanguinarius]|nr:hypothetical protein [Mycoblastus sanguinarius]
MGLGGLEVIADECTQGTQGIMTLYANHASRNIANHERNDTIEMISRALVETEILAGLDRAVFPPEYHFTFYFVVMISNQFETFWIGHAVRLSLNNAQLVRYTPDLNLLQWDPPTDGEYIASEILTSATTSNGSNGSTYYNSDAETPDHALANHYESLSLSGNDNDDDYVNPEDAANARRLSGPPRPRQPHQRHHRRNAVDLGYPPNNTYRHHRRSNAVDLGYPLRNGYYTDPRAILGDSNGLRRETGDDGEYGGRGTKNESTVFKNRNTNKKPKATDSDWNAELKSTSHHGKKEKLLEPRKMMLKKKKATVATTAPKERGPVASVSGRKGE